jgi:uncharacterized protein (TIGR02284 family)
LAIDTDEVISALNSLIETCKDGRQGFQTAAGGVKGAELKTLFNTYAQQREQFSAELEAEVRRLGGDPQQTGSVAASLHRGWINIKAAVTGEDEHAVITECERGEDSAIRNYMGVLQDELPADVRTIIERQLRQVKEAHDQLRELERAGDAGA